MQRESEGRAVAYLQVRRVQLGHGQCVRAHVVRPVARVDHVVVDDREEAVEPERLLLVLDEPRGGQRARRLGGRAHRHHPALNGPTTAITNRATLLRLQACAGCTPAHAPGSIVRRVRDTGDGRSHTTALNYHPQRACLPYCCAWAGGAEPVAARTFLDGTRTGTTNRGGRTARQTRHHRACVCLCLCHPHRWRS